MRDDEMVHISSHADCRIYTDRHLTQASIVHICRHADCVRQRTQGWECPILPCGSSTIEGVGTISHRGCVVSWVARVGLPICCEGAYVILNPAMATFHLGWIPLG